MGIVIMLILEDLYLKISKLTLHEQKILVGILRKIVIEEKRRLVYDELQEFLQRYGNDVVAPKQEHDDEKSSP